MARSFRSFPQGTGTARSFNQTPRAVSGQPRRRRVRSGRALTGSPPREQLLAGGVLADGAVVEAHRQEVVVRLAEHRTGTDAQRLGDLVAVELGAHGGELLLGSQPLDACLEVVVGAREPLGLAHVAGGAVGAGEP